MCTRLLAKLYACWQIINIPNLIPTGGGIPTLEDPGKSCNWAKDQATKGCDVGRAYISLHRKIESHMRDNVCLGTGKYNGKKKNYARTTRIIRPMTCPSLCVLHGNSFITTDSINPVNSALVMGVWIYEPKPSRHVPGTAKLYDEQTTEESPARGRGLRHATGKESNMLLVPQPSNSPNDPLVQSSLTGGVMIEYWANCVRIGRCGNEILLYSSCASQPRSVSYRQLLMQSDSVRSLTSNFFNTAAVLGPAIAPIGAVLVEEFNTTYAVVATFSGWQFWPAGVAGLMGSAVGRVWGKRPVYLVSIILVFGGAIWNATATSANSFLGSRILQGFGLGAFETIVPSTIGDMYFVGACFNNNLFEVTKTYLHKSRFTNVENG